MPRSAEYRDLTFEVHDRIGLITLDRPEQRNAFTAAMGESLGRAYAHCDADDEVRAVVVTGAGDAFCAGADLAPRGDTFAAPREAPVEVVDRAVDGAVDASGEGSPRGAGGGFSSSPVRPTAWEIRKPVIAAMNGHAIGIGMTLALHCDVRFMATGAKYGIVQVRRGVLPDAHSHWTLPRVAGFAHAAELLLTGRHFTAEEAVAMGIASRALPPDAVLGAAFAMARDIAVNTAPLSVALSKRILWSDPPLTAEETDRLETDYHRVVMGREDAVEGVLAYLERREPRWTLSPTNDWPDGTSTGG
jgi:enoyl-CoA hydratase/carnithine racemase